jgi:hypothetical protein
MTQTEMILRALKAGDRLNPTDARTKFGCQRLAARIWDLRQVGYEIHEKQVVVPSGDGGSCSVIEYYFPHKS